MHLVQIHLKPACRPATVRAPAWSSFFDGDGSSSLGGGNSTSWTESLHVAPPWIVALDCGLWKASLNSGMWKVSLNSGLWKVSFIDYEGNYDIVG